MFLLIYRYFGFNITPFFLSRSISLTVISIMYNLPNGIIIIDQIVSKISNDLRFST